MLSVKQFSSACIFELVLGTDAAVLVGVTMLLPFPVSDSLLRGAEQMGMHKTVKAQFGGGMQRFSCEEDNIYENIESELCFFTSQVRIRTFQELYSACVLIVFLYMF